MLMPAVTGYIPGIAEGVATFTLLLTQPVIYFLNTFFSHNFRSGTEKITELVMNNYVIHVRYFQLLPLF